MNRILLIVLLFAAGCLTACQKSEEYGSVQYKAQAKADDDTLARFIETHGLSGIAKHVQNNDTIGVYYIVINQGLGPTLYNNATQITVGDTGKLITGAMITNLSLAEPVFYRTDSIHPSYSFGDMILGWQLGIPEVNAGGEVRLLIPSRYAYGHYAQKDLVGGDSTLRRGLPPNAILDFTIRLYDVTN